MIKLQAPVRTLDQLKALAASGRSGFAKAAQAELRRRVHQALRGEA